jgi:N-acetylmuramoyl-L-alanine amidase
MSEPTPHERQRRCALGGALVVLALALAAACTGGSVPAAITPTVPTPSVPTPPTPTETGSIPTSPSPGPTGSLPQVPQPPIVSKPIPFPESRKQEMLAYAEEHYGLDTFELVHPQVVVEHFTANSTFGPVFNTFAADQPDLGELPGTCAHFVVDTDGTIYQLVPLDIMCRHTVGLNYTAIGIEMVGLSDQDILDNPPQLAAALSLTLWLMGRFGIELRNVIGHNESLTSPLHKELVPSFRCQTHQDWNHGDMELFRHHLAGLAAMYSVALGPPATQVNSGC